MVDGPQSASLNEIRQFRGKFDSSTPPSTTRGSRSWIPPSPSPRAAAQKLTVPPSGFVAGIYARSDIDPRRSQGARQRGRVRAHQVRDQHQQGRQEVLNPEHINALRFFEGRGNRVWGARTLSSDPEWMYVNVRRLFIYLEHSIDKATQWAVFEPNNESLWRNISRTVKDFLIVSMAQRRAARHYAGAGVLRALRPHRP